MSEWVDGSTARGGEKKEGIGNASVKAAKELEALIIAASTLLWCLKTKNLSAGVSP